MLRGVSARQYFRLREFCRKRADTSSSAFNFQPLDHPGTHRPVPAVQDDVFVSTGELKEVAFLRTVPFPGVLVKSSDGAEILTHRCILAMASPILRDKLSALPRHDTCLNKLQASQLPVLQPAEPSTFLCSLLTSCCYSRAQYLDVNLSRLALMVAVAEKYEMEVGLRVLREKWVQIVGHSGSPLVAYLVAAAAGSFHGRLRDGRCCAWPSPARLGPHSIPTGDGECSSTAIPQSP